MPRTRVASILTKSGRRSSMSFRVAYPEPALSSATAIPRAFSSTRACLATGPASRSRRSETSSTRRSGGHPLREVMDEIVAGKANKVIAIDFEISERTVELHRSRIMKKMQARSVAELVRMVLPSGPRAPAPEGDASKTAE